MDKPLAASAESIVLKRAVVRVHTEKAWMVVRIIEPVAHIQDIPISMPALDIMKSVLRPSLSMSKAPVMAAVKFQIWLFFSSAHSLKPTCLTCNPPLIAAFVEVLMIPTPSRTRLI